MSNASFPRRPSPAALILCAGALVASGAAFAQGAAALAGLPSLGANGPTNPNALYFRSGALAPPAGATTFAQTLTAQRARTGSRIVIQLDGPMTPDRRARLAAAGVRTGEYLPMHAYVVSLDAGARAEAIDALDFIRWSGLYADAWKLDPDIGTRQYVDPDRQAIAAMGRVVVNAQLFQGEAINAAIDAVNTIDGVSVHASGTMGDVAMLTIELAADKIGELAAIGAVQAISEAPEATMRNSTSATIVQSGLVGVSPLYNNGLTGAGQIGGLMDGKVNSNHCAFSDPGTPIGPSHRKILAYNTSLGSASHGTHTAGTFVGDGGTSANQRGVAYAAKLVFDDTPGFLNGTTLYNNLVLHHTQGARAHSNSWGADFRTDYNAWTQAIDRFSRDFEESLVAFAITNQSVLYTPENAKSVLAVGASQDNSSVNNHCSGGQGPTADGRRKPEVYAPGCATTSAASGSSCGTTSMTGTSMACPAATGAALLVRQYFTDGYYPSGVQGANPSIIPTGAPMRAVLINGSLDMTGVAGYPSNREGWGRLVADHALAFPGDQRRLLVQDIRNSSAESLSTGEDFEYQFDVTGSTQQLRVTMAFTDVPAVVNAAFAPINDVSLEVTAPNGTTIYRGNVFAGGVSTTGGAFDTINCVEQVHVSNPATGTWTARVIGAAVNQQTQGFALVVTGQVAEPVAECPGDTNGDFAIDFDDLNAVLSQFAQSGAGLSGDVDADNDVDFDDMNMVLTLFGSEC